MRASRPSPRRRPRSSPRGASSSSRGPLERGLEKERATKIFDLIEFFGGYGFNKSHTCAYALVAYQTAYLKTHYPSEFMAALLSSEMDGSERDKFFVDHIDDCRRMGIEVLQPDVNAGEMDFSVAEEGKILFGLGAIKGVGTKAIEALVKARKEGGPFRSVLDIFERTTQTVVTQGNVETLIKAGALDCLKARRSQLLAVLPRVAKEGQIDPPGQEPGAALALRLGPRPTPSPSRRTRPSPCPTSPRLPDAQRLAEEKKALGFYMTSHPLTRHAAMLQALATHQVADIPGARRQGRGRPRRDGRRLRHQERPEEPRRRHPDAQDDLRGPQRARCRRCSGRRTSPSTRRSSRKISSAS